MRLAIPAYIPETHQEIEALMSKFGRARRRAYSMKQKGAGRLEIIRRLREELGLHTRYIWTAYDMIKDLPPHVTFGGLRLKELRVHGEISREEYKARRNSILACMGQAYFKGNQCLRVVGDGLRINVRPRRWIHLPFHIPERYEGYRGHLDGSKPYHILLKRRGDGKGYDVRITIDIEELKPDAKPGRVLALDMNSGHIDFAVAEANRVMAVGRLNCHEVQHAGEGKVNNLLHRVSKKLWSLVRHYRARIVYGMLNTSKFKGNREANRKVKRIPHRRLGLILERKLGARRRSEAGTTKLGERLSKPLGLDVHKCSAIAFALKVLDYERFKLLLRSYPCGAAPDERDGILRRWQGAGCGLTAPRQAKRLARDEAKAEATPGFMGPGGGFKSLLPACILQIKI